MRPDQIKFRGKLKKDGKWVYGYFYEECENTYIIEDRQHNENDLCARNTPHIVNPDTIGQLTMVNDVYDKPAYEGDIVRVYHNGHPSCYQIVFQDGCFRLTDRDGYIWFSIDVFPFEVIGNIFDNKYLLED